MNDKIILGIDVGGTGIKGAIVDIEKGILLTDRFRLNTPQKATPQKIAKTVSKLVKHFDWKGNIGCGFPAKIKKGVAKTATNIDRSWIDVNVETLFSDVSNCPTYVCNDADAASLAEVKFGAGKEKTGLVMMITIGTGLGSTLILNGDFIRNTELGHLFLKGQNKIAELFASNAVRKKEELTWMEWGKRFNEYLNHLEFILSPDLFILGGGVSKKMDLFFSFLTINTEVVPAKLFNHAGIIGAALYAKKSL